MIELCIGFLEDMLGDNSSSSGGGGGGKQSVHALYFAAGESFRDLRVCCRRSQRPDPFLGDA